jgi:hypothetical protein
VTNREPREHRPSLEALDNRILPAVLTPVYSESISDAVTIDNALNATSNKVVWTIDPGADDYQTDSYERPVAQTFEVRGLAGGGQAFAAKEYFSNLDIAEARSGLDGQYLYLSIKMAGLDKWTEDGKRTHEGLAYRYGFRLARSEDGGGGYLVTSDQPSFKVGTNWSGLGTFIHHDFNGDVGGTGRDVTKQDRAAEVQGNGYENVVASDGRAAGRQVVWVRVDPTDPTTVEFALDYAALGLAAEEVAAPAYLEFEANKGLKDPANYLWNDEYTKSEAGSPYRAETGDRSKSEFGTQGLGNIYELDTLRGEAPPPTFATLSGSVYEDLNFNGTLDGNDLAITGVTITLTGFFADGTSFTLATETDDQGAYQFGELPAATYQVVESQPGGFNDGPDHVGTVNGEIRGELLDNDLIGGISLVVGQDGVSYDFTEVRILN